MSEPAPPPPVLSDADPELLRQILTERAIETEPYHPGFGDYAEYLSTRGWEALRDSVRDLLGGFFGADLLDGAFDLFGVLAKLLLVALLVVLLIWLYRWWKRQLKPELTVLLPATPTRPTPSIGLDWETELQQRMAMGDGRGSLEALWWWLATRLGISATSGEVEAALTTRELLEKAGRRDLRRFGQTLDRLLYGESQPQLAAIVQLYEEFRRVLPQNSEARG